MRSLALLQKSEAALPPQGAYNAGQKLYALMVYICLPLIMISGLVMSFHLFGTTAVQWAMVIHFLLVGIVVSGLMIHVYMGAVFPEERPAFYSMITGMVDELYAYRHHFKWWADVKRRQQEWQDSLKHAAAGSEISEEVLDEKPAP
jgi:formate dehydrogenase subunit gamma